MSEPRRLRSVSSQEARQPTDIPERAGKPPSYDTLAAAVVKTRISGYV